MLPLSGSEFPTSAETLRQVAPGRLRRVRPPAQGGRRRGARVARDRRALDRSHRRARHRARCACPEGCARAAPSSPSAQLRVVAAPLLLRGQPGRSPARGARRRFRGGDRREAAKRRSLCGVPARERSRISIRREDLQALALAVGREAAKGHGGELQDLQLDLQAEGERALRFEAKATAKMGFMKAHLTLTGRAELDDALALRLSNLDLKGQGMASTVAAGFIRPQLEKVQGKADPAGGRRAWAIAAARRAPLHRRNDPRRGGILGLKRAPSRLRIVTLLTRTARAKGAAILKEKCAAFRRFSVDRVLAAFCTYPGSSFLRTTRCCGAAEFPSSRQIPCEKCGRERPSEVPSRPPAGTFAGHPLAAFSPFRLTPKPPLPRPMSTIQLAAPPVPAPTLPEAEFTTREEGDYVYLQDRPEELPPGQSEGPRPARRQARHQWPPQRRAERPPAQIPRGLPHL